MRSKGKDEESCRNHQADSTFQSGNMKESQVRGGKGGKKQERSDNKRKINHVSSSSVLTIHKASSNDITPY